MSASHPVRYPTEQSSASDIADGLALVRLCRLATDDPGWMDTEAIKALCTTLGMAERLLAAGADWAADVENARIDAELAGARRTGRARAGSGAP